MHTEHHRHDVKSTSGPSRPDRPAIDPDLSNERNVTEPLAECILDEELGVEGGSTSSAGVMVMVRTARSATSSSTSVSHLSIAFASLFDGDVGRVDADVQFDRLKGLLPFPEITSLAAAEVEDEQAP